MQRSDPRLALFVPFPDLSSTSPVLREPNHGALQHQEAEVRTWGAGGAAGCPRGVMGVGEDGGEFWAPHPAEPSPQPAHVHRAAEVLHPLHHVCRRTSAQVSSLWGSRVGICFLGWGSWLCAGLEESVGESRSLAWLHQRRAAARFQLCRLFPVCLRGWHMLGSCTLPLLAAFTWAVRSLGGGRHDASPAAASPKVLGLQRLRATPTVDPLLLWAGLQISLNACIASLLLPAAFPPAMGALCACS